MRTKALVGVLLIGLGLAALAFAPRTQICLTDYDATVCETALVIVFNIAGALLIIAGGILLAFRRRHNIAV